MTGGLGQGVQRSSIRSIARRPARHGFALSRRGRERLFKGVMYVVLTLGGITMLIPFIWLTSTSLKMTGREFSYPPELIPNPVMWGNFPEVLWGKAKILMLMRNTLVVCLVGVSAVALSSSLAAFGFARLPFPGRSFWFTILLATMMLPEAVTIIPRFILFRSLKWINTWLPLIVPAFCGGAYNIFLLRQFFLTIPKDYDEAARMDGASSFRIWWQIIMPLSRPVLATVVVLNFLWSWNAFLEPLIYISNYSKQMIGVGLTLFRGQTYSRWNLMMAGAFIQLVPVLVIFFAAQQYIIRGIVMTGISGR